MVCPYTGCRFSVIRTVTRRYKSSPSSKDSADNRFYLAGSTPFYPGLTGKSGYFFCGIFTLSCGKTKNILDTALCFNGGDCYLSCFYSGRKRTFLNRELSHYKRSAAERFGKSRCSAGDDLSFAVDAAGADSDSGYARHGAR